MSKAISSQQNLNVAVVNNRVFCKKRKILKPRILVVEDNPINQYVACFVLVKNGYHVDIAETGKRALCLYKNHRYDFILMDIELPDISGIEVTQKIRKMELKNGLHTPIIALTANGIGAKKECLSSGMDGFSEKPFESKRLLQLIKSWLKN